MRVTTAALPGGHVLVTLAGEIDVATAPAVSEAIREAVEEASAGVVIDLGQVTFLGAAGLHVLAEAAHTARHLTGRVRLRAVPPPVQRLLSLTGLRHRLPVLPAIETQLTREPALA